MVRNHFLSPLQGSASISGLTPGSRPVYSLPTPPGLASGGANYAIEAGYWSFFTGSVVTALYFSFSLSLSTNGIPLTIHSGMGAPFR